MQGLDHLPDFRPRQRVIDVLAVAAGLDQVVRAQPRQLLGHRRLPELQELFDFGDRLFAFDQEAQDHQPRLMRERLEEFARSLRVLQQVIDVEFGLFRLAGQRGRHDSRSVRMRLYMR